MPLTCETLLQMVTANVSCELTEAGLRIPTQCLYPSAEPVHVHVAALGDGFVVTDAGGVSRTVFVHGRDADALNAGLIEASNRHGLRVESGALFADAPHADWLPAAIAAVANGAALAASVAIDHSNRKAESRLSSLIYQQLSTIVPERFIARAFEYRGKSGKSWKIDFAVLDKPDAPILIKAVTPHHNSVSANYTAFGDIGSTVRERFCVYQRALEPEDSALLRQVASLVPVARLGDGTQELIRQLH